MSIIHHYLAFPGGGVSALRKLGQTLEERHDLDGILEGPEEGEKWRIVASEMIHASEGPDVALYYVIPASVPPHHEALYLSQALVKAATK